MWFNRSHICLEINSTNHNIQYRHKYYNVKNSPENRTYNPSRNASQCRVLQTSNTIISFNVLLNIGKYYSRLRFDKF